MKRLMPILFGLLFFLTPVFAADAANDLILTQRKADNSGNIQRNVAPAANGFLGFNSSKIPTEIDLTWATAAGTTTITTTTGNGLTLATLDGNKDITFTPHGTGGVVVPSTVTAGIKLYNTADQTTNPEFTEFKYSANVFRIRSSSLGTGLTRSISLGVGSAREVNVNIGSSSTIIDLSSGSYTVVNGTGVDYTGTFTQTSGTTKAFAIRPTYNQSSGTAANTDLLINRIETAVGSGEQLLADFQVGGASRAKLSNLGALTLGTAGTTAGSLVFANATSGSITIAPPTGALGTVTNTPQAVTDTFVYRATTDTLTNKRINPRVISTTDDATAVIDLATTDTYELTAVANATTFSTTGTPADGQKIIIRYKDAGVAKGLTWDAIFVAIGVTLPTTTTVSKWGYVGAVYNSAASKFHVIAVTTES